MSAQRDWRSALRDGLAGTSLDDPRPVAPLDLPVTASHLMDEAMLAGLRAAAVLVPVVARADEPQVLLAVRAEGLRKHAGQIGFPGGRAEAGDDGPVATALRESHEEVGLTAEHVEIAGYLDDYPTISGYRVTPVVGVVAPQARVSPDGREIVEIFEVPLSFVLDPDNYQRRYLERDGLRLPYWMLRYGERFIWGATAGMLRDFMCKLRGAR